MAKARGTGDAGSIIGPAWSMRWQAPEMALTLADRALAGASQPEKRVRLWADVIAVSASCRLGRHLAVVDRAITALRLAEQLADPHAAAVLRTELAGCARAAGMPLAGGVVL